MFSVGKRMKLWALVALLVGVSMTAIVVAHQQAPESTCGNQPCVDASQADPQLNPGIEALRANYIERGYFWVFVEATRQKNGSIAYRVTPGDIYRFDHATVTGASDEWAKEFSSTLAMKPGDIYRPSLVKAWLDPLVKGRSLPFGAPAYVPKRITFNTDRENHTMSLVLEVSER